MKKRKKYSKEFKQDAVRLVTEQGYAIAEAARNLGTPGSEFALTAYKTRPGNPLRNSLAIS
jgi:transposase-like protein